MDNPNLNLRKRPRPVVSCLRCRAKKLKCDRTAPCENCAKALTAHTCTYKKNGQMPSEEVMLVPTGTAAGSLEDLQLRMARVEELLGVKSEALSQASEQARHHYLGTVVVKGDRSVYHGQNDRVTLLNQFLDVKDFINNGMSKDESIQASAKQVQFLQTKSATKIASPDSVIEPAFSLPLLKLRECLPPKSYCDRLVHIYCNHFERTMRVLHIPTFMRHYEELWAASTSEAYNTPSVIPQLTVVLTMAYHMEAAEEFTKDQAHRSYLKRTANDLVQAWLDELSRKQRTELSTLQVETLLLLSRSLRGMHPEKLWSSTGALVRSAMAMGLHLSPSTAAGFAPYQAELRRRIWVTVLEIDLQASMATGMPVVLPNVESSSLDPSNLNDLDFDESTTTLPKSHGLDVYTDSSYQVVLASSLECRLKALSAIQRPTPDIEEAVSLGRNVENYIDGIPQVVSLRHNSVAPFDGGSLMHTVLLDLYLRRPVLCLYKPLLLASPQTTPSYAEMQRRCLEFSMAILSYQDLYTVPALSTVASSPMAHQNFFYRCCKMDILWAALSCCQRIKVIRRGETAITVGGKHGANITSLVKRVETTIDCLVTRIGQKGSDLKDLVFIALALQAVQLPDPNPLNKQVAADRSRALHRTVSKTLSACRERLLLPIFATDRPHTPPPAKDLQTLPAPLSTATTGMVPPTILSSRLTPLPVADMAFPDLPEDAEHWFGSLPDLAAEFTNFEAEMSNPGDFLNFGIAQEWNWEHMWQ